MLHGHINELQRLLSEFLGDSFSRSDFVKLFSKALERYKETINDRPYYPLNDICQLNRFSDEEFKKYCLQALERLPREELDRTTRHWLEKELVDDDAFNFFKPDGVSKFGESAVLYSSKIDGESFLLSALNGTLKPLSFRYVDLLAALKVVGNSELAAWVYCSEPDNAFAHIENVWSLGSVYEEPSQLSQIEQTRGDSVQWGNCYLLLLPKSKSWMLVNHCHFDGFEIALHGHKDFIGGVLRHNSLMNTDGFAAGYRDR